MSISIHTRRSRITLILIIGTSTWYLVRINISQVLWYLPVCTIMMFVVHLPRCTHERRGQCRAHSKNKLPCLRATDTDPPPPLFTTPQPHLPRQYVVVHGCPRDSRRRVVLEPPEVAHQPSSSRGRHTQAAALSASPSASDSAYALAEKGNLFPPSHTHSGSPPLPPRLSPFSPANESGDCDEEVRLS